MKKRLTYKLLVIFCILGSNVPAFSQAKSEQDLLKQGNKLFYEDNFSGASTYFLQLLSLNQTNAEYNYKYGTCLLYSDGDKNKALKYLVYAAAKGAGLDKEVYYYTARALHLNYRFADAIKYYQQYAAVASDKDKEKFLVNRQIDMCNNGKRLLRNITDIVVVSKKDYREADFFRLYNPDEIEGKILVAEDLLSGQDKKKNHRIIINQPNHSDIVYYASYGDDGKSKDIYRVKKLGTTWSKPQAIKGLVNTPYDEDYPFMHPDGRTLYFCSKGHNSMGGYDVFKSTFDPETETFSQPENMDFAINTPDDDILYILDSLEQSAYFASKRESGLGKVHVYNVKVQRFPVLIAILKGRFVNEVTPGKNGASITVEDMATNEVVGLFSAKSANGDYLVTLPKSGKYRYKVKCEGNNKEYAAVVDIPYQKELKPLKQEIALVKKDDEEVLVIRNMFDQEIDGADEIIAEVLKDKASLNPNIENFPDSLLEAGNKQPKDSLADVQVNENLTNADLVKLASEQAENQQKEATELKEKMEAAYAVAAQKTKEANDKAKQAEENLVQAEDIIDPLEKGMLYDEAKKLNDEAAKNSNEAVIALNLAQSLEKQHEKSQRDANVSKEYATAIEKAINSKNKDEAIKQLKQQQDYIKSLMSANTGENDLYAETKKKAGDKREEASRALKQADGFKAVENELNNEISQLTREAENAKGSKKKEIQDKIAEKQNELAAITEKKKDAFKKAESLVKEADQLDDQAELLAGILENPSTPAKVLTEDEKKQLAGTIKSDSENIAENNEKIEEKTQVDRQKKFDYNDFLAKYDYYANMFNEYERLKRSLFTAEDYDRLINHNENWLSEIENDLAKTADEEKNADENKKKQLAAKRSQLNQLKQAKQQENASLRIERQKLLDRLAKNNGQNTNSELAKVNDPAVSNANQKNQDKLNQIDKSNASEQRKAMEKTKANNELVAELEKEIEKEKKALPNLSGEEKQKATEKIKILEESKTAKQAENAQHYTALNNTGIDPGLGTSVSDKVSKTSPLNNIVDIENQVEKTKKIKEEVIALAVEKSETTDKQQQEALDKELKAKTNELYVAEEKLANSIETENQGIFNAQEKAIENKSITANAATMKQADQLADDAAKLQDEAKALFVKAKNETEPRVKNTLLEEAIDKQNQALEKQKEALALLENNSGTAQNNTNNNTAESTNPLTAQQKELVSQLMSDFADKENAIRTSDKTETQKLAELKIINEELVKKIENELSAVQRNTGNLPAEERKQKTAELTALLAQKREELGMLDAKLITARVIEPGTDNTGLRTYNLNPLVYEDATAQKEYNTVKAKVDNLTENQHELMLLKVKLAETTDAKEKQKIQAEIDRQEKDIVKQELDLAKSVEKINTAEINRNQQTLEAAISKIDQAQLNSAQKERLENARRLMNEANAGLTKAQDLRRQAKNENNDFKKNTILKQANQLELDAIQKQRAAEEMLEILLEEYTIIVSNNTTNKDPGNTTAQLSETEKQALNEVNSNYTSELEAIKTSNQSELRKTYAENELNKDLVSKLENEITKLQTGDKNLTEEEKRKRKLKIEELNRLLDLKKKELGITEEKLKEANVIDGNNTAESTHYSTTLLVQDKNAVSEKQKIEPALAAITADKNKLAETRLTIAETTNAAEKQKLEKQAATQEEKINRAEIALAPNIEKINHVEFTARQNSLATQELKLAGHNLVLDNETAGEVNMLKAEAEKSNNEAAILRRQAADEKDIAKKNALLKQAHQNETNAISKLAEAEQLVNQYLQTHQDEMASVQEQYNAAIAAVDNTYAQQVKDIENSGQSDLRKTNSKAELNEALIAKIQTEINALEKDLSQQSTDEQQRRKVKLEDLYRLLGVKQKELAAQQELLSGNGIAQNKNGDYTRPLTYQNSIAKSLMLEAQTRTNELQREQAKLTELQLKKAESTNTAEQNRLANEIKAQEKIIAEKELSLAKVFGDINKAEITENKTQIASLQNRVVQNKSVDKNSEAVLNAENNIAKASQDIADASKLRTEADRQTNKDTRNRLLKEAFNKEQEAIAKQQEAEGIYEKELAEIEIISLNTHNNNTPENKNPGNTGRASDRQLKLAEELNQKADDLLQRAATVRDSAQTVKKKQRPLVLDMADKLKLQSEEARTEANQARNLYEELKRQEDEQVAAQQEKEKQENAARAVTAEVVNMNEYARYYQLQQEANNSKNTLAASNQRIQDLRNKAAEQKTEAYNLQQDAGHETDAVKKQELLNKAADAERKATRYTASADSLENINTSLAAQYNQKQQEADAYLATVNADKVAKINTLIGPDKNNLVKPEVNYISQNITKVDNPVEFVRNFKAPEEVKNDIYIKSDVAAYSNENPIPVNTAAPKGIYFKVQVGAFRNPIPQDLFKQFVPITGETTNTGITRYTVGYFTQYTNANEAKNEIRGMGYQDAFVVGFKDGKRIPVTEALRLLNGQPLASNNANNANATNTNNTDNTNNNAANNNTNNATNNTTNSNTNNTANTNTNLPPNTTLNTVNVDNAAGEFNAFTADATKTNYYKDVPNAVKANQVEVIKGLFYTVQVGVYSKPVTPDKIFNLRPLNSELTPTLKIRYTTGIYNTMENAVTRRNETRTAGVNDAFVTAYFNGKRITLDQARQLESKYGNTIMADPKNLTSNTNVVNNTANNVTNNNAGNNTNAGNNNAGNNNTANNNTGNNTNANTENNNTTGTYTIILGEYAGEVPAKDAEIFLTNKNAYTIYKTTRNGKAAYFTETTGGKAEADKIKAFFQGKGIANPTVLNTKLTGQVSNVEARVVEPKQQDGLRFQVYLGEYVDEVPEDDAMIYLNNVSKGVKRKTNAEGFTIYYTCDCESYDKALELKAHFVQEGITAVRIVPFMNEKEISIGDAFKLIYE